LILVANDAHPTYRLVVAANRDEFYGRPTTEADWWQDNPTVLAGRDLRSGGTWMGVTRSGRFAAITNFREPAAMMLDAPSRGRLVVDALTSPLGPTECLEQLRLDSTAYNGFNLLVGRGDELGVWSNRGADKPRRVSSGVFGLSNDLFDTPWPKVEGGKRDLEAALELSGEALVNRVFEILADRQVPEDGTLPDTGVGLELERMLGSRFIVSPIYGTRASYVVLFARSGEITFVEQSFDHGEPDGERSRFEFQVERAT
jgi:uncharacterized protein with NRDE domain